jgi:hypothetical protein
MRIFREGLKQEQKSMKQELEELPKDQRKSSMRVKKQYLDRDQQERVCVENEKVSVTVILNKS